ncbi:MAG: hypothetical protein H0U65_05665 [Rubrobacter sp.]|nr:hypothetical protein [Rubrobacter sp.]
MILDVPGSGPIVSKKGHIDEAILRRRLRKMRRGEVCYLFPEAPELGPDTNWHGYVQKVEGGARCKRGFAIQGHRGTSIPDQRYREVGLEAAVSCAMKTKPRAMIVS